LQVGDVIRLNSTVHQDMVACVNGQPKFLCQPGIVKKQLAVSIEESIEMIDHVEGFGALAKDTHAYDVAG
ncbi:MAG: FliM/FliN family flagellar motor switch protein, partial [Vampirovibrionales bacterium]